MSQFHARNKTKKTSMINWMTEQFSRNSFLPQNRRSQTGFPLRPAMPLLGASSASKTTMVRCLLPSVAPRTLRNLACAAAGQRKKNNCGVFCLTLLETNVAPEKCYPKKKLVLLSNHPCSTAILNFRGVMHMFEKFFELLAWKLLKLCFLLKNMIFLYFDS